jgi:hypothetical protein
MRLKSDLDVKNEIPTGNIVTDAHYTGAVYSDSRAGCIYIKQKSCEFSPNSLEVYDLITFLKTNLFKALSIRCKIKTELILLRVKLREKLDTES